jgi:hypothetical protein
VLDETLPKSFHRSGPTRKRLRDPFVGPVRTIGICLQQNLSTPHFLPSPLQPLHNFLKFDSFWLR